QILHVDGGDEGSDALGWKDVLAHGPATGDPRGEEDQGLAIDMVVLAVVPDHSSLPPCPAASGPLKELVEEPLDLEMTADHTPDRGNHAGSGGPDRAISRRPSAHLLGQA